MRAAQPVRPTHLAAMLDVAGRDVLIVGGGVVAARRAGMLLDARAAVRVVSPALSDELAARHRDGEIGWKPRGFQPGDCRGAFLVVVASDDPAVNAAAVADARACGALVNDAETPGRGDLQIPAVLRRGSIQVAVGGGGAGPVVAAFVRDRLDERLGPELARLAELAGAMRDRDRAAGVDLATRRRHLESRLPRLLELLERGEDAEAERLAAAPSAVPAALEEPAWS